MFNGYFESLGNVSGLVFGMLFLCHVASAQPPQAKKEQWKPIDMSNFDLSVKPDEDFYHYANGGWMKNNPIPADESRWGSFNELIEHNRNILHEILEDAAKKTDAPKGSNLQKVGDFYFSGMDEKTIEANGAKPLADEFSQIAAMKTTDDLIGYIAHIHTMNARSPFSFGVGQDAKSSTDQIAQMYQGGLGLPDRDYYTKDDDKSKTLREEYLAHVEKMFSLLGDDKATAHANAATVMAMETRLAKASMTRVERRDPDKTYHKMSVDELSKLTPNIAWNKFFEGLGNKNPGNVNVGMPEFMKEVDKMLTDVKMEDWKTYLRWHMIHETADFLSSDFVNENFNFYGKTLTGATELQARWKRVQETVDGEIGEALGELYVAKAFSPKAKAKAKEMVENLRKSLHERIQHLEWMSEDTKKAAIKKLEAFGVKIGYPDKWRDYSALTIDRGAYVLNVIRTEQFDFQYNLNKIGKPVDRTEWGMTPPTVNAYYSAQRNEIVFPAGILQPPFYDEHADDAINYGGIGAVIGHEMTHGFDDQGRKFDADGNLKDWWTEDDAKKYTERSSVIEKQFSGYVAIDTVHVNGKLTLGENTADLGGLTVAYAAFQAAKGVNKKQELIDGFTPEQRFFLSWAQVWRQNIRDEALRLRLNTDPHSPGRFRGMGPLTNMVEFQKAFNIKDDSPMVRKERAKIW